MLNTKLNKILNELTKLSKKLKKKTAFIISNTSDKKTKYYFTPVRKSKNCIYAGAVVYDDLTTKKICQQIKDKINFLFIDTEKKSSNNSKGAINIERTARENIDNKKIFYFKANDLTVDASSDFLEYIFQDDIRNISNKRVLILGSGNIGVKLSLKLIERGVKVFLYGRNFQKTKNIISVINLIKPKATLNNVKQIKKIVLNKLNYDVVINATNSSKTLIKKDIITKKKIILLEIGKNFFSNLIHEKLLQKPNIKTFRLDATSAFNQLIEKKINTRDHWKKKSFERLDKGQFSFITLGLLGKTGDIVVDNTKNPKIFYERIDKNKRVSNLSKDEKKLLKKLLKKL